MQLAEKYSYGIFILEQSTDFHYEKVSDFLDVPEGAFYKIKSWICNASIVYTYFLNIKEIFLIYLHTL